MNMLDSAIRRFGVDCLYFRDGEEEPYRTARALVSGYASGTAETLQDRGRQSGVTRVLFIASPDAPPAARFGYLRFGGAVGRVTRCELIGCDGGVGYWRAVAALESEVAV